MRIVLRSKVLLLFVSLGMTLAVAGVALADIVVVNDAGVTGDSLKKPGTSGIARVYLTEGDNAPVGDVSGCNANTSDPVYVELGARNPNTLAADNDITFTGNPVSITACDHSSTTAIENPFSALYTVASGAPDKTVEIYVKRVTGGIELAGGTIFGKYITGDTHKVRIDGTGPAITITTPPPGGASYNVNQVVNAAYSCDDGAGNAGTTVCAGTGWDGSPIDTASAGTKTFTVNAKDALGNTSTLSRDYDVVDDPNHAPTVSTDAGSVSGNEGDTLTNNGAFSDQDGDTLTITKDSGAGTVTQGANGAWSWSLPTNDQDSGTVVVKADDGQGGTVTDSFNWSASGVAYEWTGFFAPVDNMPTFNVVKGGSSVPLKFNLGGDQGMGILAAGYPKSTTITCDSTAEVDALETVATAGSSGLNFDSTTNQYNYTWKTEKTWTSGCRQVEVKLIDGTSHRANFKFIK